MKLSSSPKIFENYKCDSPKNTIKKIEEGFQKIGLKISYNENKVGDGAFSTYLGHAYIDIFGWGQYGKGTTSLLAKASSYAELVERFSTGCFEIKIPFSQKPGTYQNLLTDVNQKTFLKGFTKNNNQELTNLDAVKQYFHEKLSKETHELFKKDGLFDFVADAYSIIKNKQVKVPIQFIDIISNTNGLAAGNSLEEAFVHASCEVFERYASIKIISNKIECPTIDQNSIEDKRVQNCLRMLKSSNIDVVIKDFTLNGSIPAVGVLFIDRRIENDGNKLKKNRDYKRINVGSHVNLNEAITRCFNENLQVLNLHKEKLDELYYSWTKTLNKKYIGSNDDFRFYVKDFDYYKDLSFLEKGKNISLNSLNSIENDDSLNDIKCILHICKNNNWDLLLVDYTHKVIQFPTVRVIIPPISTDFDPFGKRILKIKNFQKKFNYYYGIKDFYKYLQDDKWINDKNKIKDLITNIENYLSAQLDHFYIYVTRENNYFQLINLFHILPFLYLSINQYKTAEKYFKILLKLDFHPPVESSFFNSLYQSKYNPAIYKTYIDMISNLLEKDCKQDFTLKTNPFSPEKGPLESEDYYISLLKNINDSFK